MKQSIRQESETTEENQAQRISNEKWAIPPVCGEVMRREMTENK